MPNFFVLPLCPKQRNCPTLNGQNSFTDCNIESQIRRLSYYLFVHSSNSFTNSTITLFLMGFLTNRACLMGGGQICPLVIWLSEGIFIIFFKLQIQKSDFSSKIKPRHLGCSVFLQKDRNGHTQKVNEFQYVLVRQNFKKYRI